MESLDPELHAGGLKQEIIDIGRYDGQSADPLEVAGILHAMMPSAVRVLDVGCGTGSVTLIANRDHDNKRTAVESYRDWAMIARSRGVDVHNGILDDDFIAAQGLFDVVMASDVLEHTQAPSEFLQMMIKAAKPDGLLLLSVPSVAHWSVRANLLFGRFDYASVGIMDATRLRWSTSKPVIALLKSSGVEIIDLRQTAGFTMPVYGHGVARRVPTPLRNGLIRGGTRMFPLLFGCQHVVKARVPQSIH